MSAGRDRRGNETSADEARARAAVDRLEEALGRQLEAFEARSWQDAPKHIREAHGDPSLPDPPTEKAMKAWFAWIDLRQNSARQCWENIERARADAARAEIYWKRAVSNAERALAELDDVLGRQAIEYEDLPDDVIAVYLALLEEYRDRQVVSDAVLPAPAARLRAALERRYQRSADPALAEALIALPVFVPPDDADAVQRYLVRPRGKSGSIGGPTWDRAITVVKRIAGEQRVAMRQSLGAAPGAYGLTSPVPILSAVTNARTAAVKQATYNASGVGTVASYGASGLATLPVLGVAGFLLGEPAVALVLVQIVLLVIGFLPALGVMHQLAMTLTRRAADAGKAEGSVDTVVGATPFVLPMGIAVVSWLIVTSQ